jgi:hypothetical protein
MERWASLGNASAAQTQSRRRQRGDDSDVLRELTIDNSRLLTRLARVVASHSARLSHTVLCPPSLQLLGELERVDSDYARVHRPDSNSTELPGAIYKYKWACIVMTLAVSDKATPDDKSILSRHRDEIGDPVLLQDFVVFCNDIPAEGKTKIIFTVTDDLKLPLGAILRVLTNLGCTVCHETMPRLPEERRITANLAKLGVTRRGRRSK